MKISFPLSIFPHEHIRHQNGCVHEILLGIDGEYGNEALAQAA